MRASAPGLFERNAAEAATTLCLRHARVNPILMDAGEEGKSMRDFISVFVVWDISLPAKQGRYVFRRGIAS
jgi:hypothetical protein